MTEYAILVLPSANRVYTDTSPRLLRAELRVIADAVGIPLAEVGEARLGGVDYVTFSTEPPLSSDDIALLSNASSLYALFEVADGLLRPVELSRLDRLDSDLLTIQKYAGKTNELFTKLLVNVTCMAMAEPRAMLARPLRLLDPLCGRGTTLSQAMMYGFDAAGVEMDKRDYESYEHFLKSWMRTKRLKHTADAGQLRVNKVALGGKLDVSYALSKEDLKAGEVRTVAYRRTDTLRTADLFGSGAFDVIVADAPYGVQHGSHHASELSRTPRELLAEAVPVWARTLRPGGAMGISWNTKVLPREDLAAILAEAGLEVRDGGPFEEFAHRVDQAITRDLIVATKPA